MADNHTAKDVASYMKECLEKKQFLYQETVVIEIKKKFGKDFVYKNANGNLAIEKEVLAEFRKLTPDAVWEKGDKCWRKRMKYDDTKSRSQD